MSSSVPEPVPDRPGSAERLPTYGFLTLLAVLVLLRLPHLTGPLEEPHAWRQCDTAQYALNFYRDGFDLLHPAVNWMGAHRTLALEFPLPEALMAAVYRVAGPGEDRARVLTLLFFAAGTWYFFLLVRRLCGPWTAFGSAAAYAVLPLSWFYSRAVLIDFYVICIAHAWAYHWLRAVAERSTLHLVVGAVLLGLGALIKPHLLIPVGIPVLAVVGVRARHDLLRFAAAGAAALVLPALWRVYVEHLNQAIPDWWFLPDYFKHAGRVLYGFYFGSMFLLPLQVSLPILGQRLGFEVLTPLGLALFVLGSVSLLQGRGERPAAGSRTFFMLWLVGSVLFVLLFYLVNVIHNYYQLSLLAPAALGIGAGLDLLRRMRIGASHVPGRIAAVLAFCLLAGSGWRYAETHYYRPQWELINAGRELQARIPQHALVVVSLELTDVRDPRTLYYARREGWSLPLKRLTPQILEALRKEGARYLAILAQTLPANLDFLPPVWAEVPLEIVPWRLWVYRFTDGDPKE